MPMKKHGVVDSVAAVASLRDRPTLLKRLAASLSHRASEPDATGDEVRFSRAFVVRPLGERVSVGLVNVDQLAAIEHLENEVVLDSAIDVEFEKEIEELILEEEIMNNPKNDRKTIRSLIESWIAEAREDQKYIENVLEKHREIEVYAAAASRRAREVLTRLER